MDITLIEGFKIALVSAGTLTLLILSAVLVRVFKILGPVLEIIDIYKKIRGVFIGYSQIPDSIKNKVKNFIKK